MRRCHDTTEEKKNAKCKNQSENDVVNDPSRRNFIKAMGIISIAAVAGLSLRGLIQNIIPPQEVVSTGFPTLTLVSQKTGAPVKTSDLQVNSPEIVLFDYPLQNEPNFLLRLGNSSGQDIQIKPVSVKIPATGKTYTSPGGVGPYKSVVASSAICQHLGCVPPEIHYYPPGTPIPSTSISGSSNHGLIHCNCHGSTYDPLNGFSVVTGPTTHPLPSVVLSYDSSTDTYKAVSMVGPTIYGHTNDLSGGNPVSGTSTDVVNEGVPSQ
ncbi:Rieske iron sulfur protein [Thermoplasma volcanium GSS1]|uniref:Rieske iron sulfur protein n=1 Tax=Thermoplasma volcanium (strain ATCC 51530 / DSM 4299 / JCM 9571 / NBRC 15438 / GSS1) TaxID=273116 RepID=Q97BT5_THEVO|nr:Rieske 2Fe-2S domain-containing protein [Thermoplasma volcanium]BAB59512.1 Rieske iron sulfur protein [Thermoplasma volcanium GSS1]